MKGLPVTAQVGRLRFEEARDDLVNYFLRARPVPGRRRELPDPLQRVLTVAYSTGWRVKSEVATLKWHQVDRARQQLRLEPGTTKNEDSRTFP